jgi:hypothetical protein
MDAAKSPIKPGAWVSFRNTQSLHYRLTGQQVRQMWLNAVVQHLPLAPLVAPEEEARSRKRTREGRNPAAIEPASESFLSEDLEVG